MAKRHKRIVKKRVSVYDSPPYPGEPQDSHRGREDDETDLKKLSRYDVIFGQILHRLTGVMQATDALKWWIKETDLITILFRWKIEGEDYSEEYGLFKFRSRTEFRPKLWKLVAESDTFPGDNYRESFFKMWTKARARFPSNSIESIQLFQLQVRLITPEAKRKRSQEERLAGFNAKARLIAKDPRKFLGVKSLSNLGGKVLATHKRYGRIVQVIRLEKRKVQKKITRGKRKGQTVTEVRIVAMRRYYKGEKQTTARRIW